MICLADLSNGELVQLDSATGRSRRTVLRAYSLNLREPSLLMRPVVSSFGIGMKAGSQPRLQIFPDFLVS